MTLSRGDHIVAFQGARRMGKQEMAIRSLPDIPSKHIYWIVYNKDMIKYTEDLIKEIKGLAYMQYITVVSKSGPTKDRVKGSIYFDPTLMDLMSNGGYG